MKTYRVLVLPGGTEIGLEIHRSLAQAKEVTLYSAGMDVPNHADCVFARHFVVPSVHQPGWIESLNRVIAENGIQYIFPAYDDVLLALAENRENLAARLITSPLKTCRITRSKSATYKHLGDIVPVPEVYECIGDIPAYPVFVKPDRGQGSQDCQVAESRDQLLAIRNRCRTHLVLEQLPGEEYTVDCFSDRERGLLFCSGRERVRTRNGISMQTRPVRDPLFEQFALAISSRLEFHGAWFFQMKRDRHGVLKLLEVAPRIAGAMAMHRVLGVNFPLLSLYEQERIPIEILAHKVEIELDRALVNRYRHNLKWRAVYVDLDDTLLLRGKVNTQVVAFLYQCLNAGARIVLLTRHAGDLADTLARHRLRDLFDEVIHLDKDARKADYIREKDAVLVDDSFRERAAVERQTGIMTFDPSMLEMLIDDRQ